MTHIEKNLESRIATKSRRVAGRAVTTLARASVLAAVLAVSAMAQHQGHAPYMEVMDKGHKETMAMKMTGDPDKDFAMMMIKHQRA